MLDLFPTFLEFFGGNIDKCPFPYWLNGRWFIQIVDIGNFNMKLNGRIVDRDSVGGRSRATELPCLSYFHNIYVLSYMLGVIFVLIRITTKKT